VDEPNTSPAAGEPQPDAAPAPVAAAAVAAAPEAAYGETWFTATGGVAPARSPLTHDLDVDVCVIGGGLAGLTTALELARRGWSVAVLEARRVAWNASSRNTGFVRPGFAQTVEKIVTRVGADHARELWMLSQDGVDFLRRSIGDGGRSDILQGEGWLQVSKTDRPRDLADEAELLRGFGADIEVWPKDLVRTKVKSPYYFQAIHFPTAFSLNPYDYALDLARRAEAAGARIFEDTPAVSIDPAGVRKRIATPHGRIRAAHIVLAGNMHLGPIVPDVAHTLVPLRTFAIVTRPLGDKLAAAIEYPGAVSDSDFADHHYRIVGGDRLLFAGRMATRDANPRRYGARLRADLRARFPQLGPVEVEHAWSGAIGVTVHLMPQIGEIAPGVWLASGFGGHGLNTTAMAATLITGAIVEGDDRFRLFEPFELVWAGGRVGRSVAKRFYSAWRRYQQWASRRARKHEAWRIANEPRLKKEAEEAAERARIRAEEAAIAEAARIEREKIAAEQAEIRRIERERIAAEKAEAARIRAEQKAVAKAEAARLKEEQRAAARAEKERIAAEKAKAKRLEADRLAAERAETERLEAERRAAEQADAERLEAAYRNAERVAENAARLIAGTSGSRSMTAQDQVEAVPAEVGSAGAEPATAEADQPATQPDAAPRRRGFWRRG
jgi:gamma-glutamylputrescine oxidase